MSKNIKWYETLEPGIRSIVRLLRDNGFNTFNSCEHQMTVDMEGDFLEATRLENFMVTRYKKRFEIESRAEIGNGYPRRYITLHLNQI